MKPDIVQCIAGTSSTITEFPHILAKVNWYQDHPRKLSHLSESMLSATVLELYTSASFIPVSRIILRCAIQDFYQDIYYRLYHGKAIISFKKKTRNFY